MIFSALAQHNIAQTSMPMSAQFASSSAVANPLHVVPASEHFIFSDGKHLKAF